MDKLTKKQIDILFNMADADRMLENYQDAIKNYGLVLKFHNDNELKEQEEEKQQI